jgi:hypothetical protein
MTRLNLNDASLLDISGELGPAARAQLHSHLAKKPAARARYNAIAAQYGRLSSLPKPALDPEEAHRIAGDIKAAIHERLDRQARVHQAQRHARFIHYALAGLSAAAAVAVVIAGLTIMESANQQKRSTEQIAHLQRVIDRLASYDRDASGPGGTAAYEQALADVDSSIRRLQAEGSSLSGLQTNEMTPLLDALASLPSQSSPDSGAEDTFELPTGGL